MVFAVKVLLVQGQHNWFSRAEFHIIMIVVLLFQCVLPMASVRHSICICLAIRIEIKNFGVFQLVFITIISSKR